MLIQLSIYSHSKKSRLQLILCSKDFIQKIAFHRIDILGYITRCVKAKVMIFALWLVNICSHTQHISCILKLIVLLKLSKILFIQWIHVFYTACIPSVTTSLFHTRPTVRNSTRMSTITICLPFSLHHLLYEFIRNKNSTTEGPIQDLPLCRWSVMLPESASKLSSRPQNVLMYFPCQILVYQINYTEIEVSLHNPITYSPGCISMSPSLDKW